ncbi:glycerol-3-phosphate responsive antiterminator [Alteribacter keqinensis]|uniref:Glycerol uptake operon antiterminator regulatory protein n=1 Tax=Alteribacter keqinensis TaxID=2483800 RepID=A0A3M7TS49_9BACI|nr:glycerol-3-phosphate responsive antiterminator [Alteribacter keqinensis]RNA67552.1 glycerol-3-phosphate responsive antiterminator [Alteribacter keqinensis]
MDNKGPQIPIITDLIESQVVAAVNSPEKLEQAINSNCNVAFLMTGDILSVPASVKKLHDNGMKVFVHLDFVDGIANDRSGIKFIAEKVRPEGIITTKNHLIKFAKKEGLITIQRLFFIDKSAIKKGIQMIESSNPDAVEILPGVIPRVITRLTDVTPLPIIVGGLIENEQEISEALEAGALAASCGSPRLWHTDL